LATVAQSALGVPKGILAIPMFHSARQLEQRIVAILNPRRNVMTKLKRWSAALIATASICGGLVLACCGAAPSDSNSGYDLSHVVHFEIGRTVLPKGDSITIEQVRGTSDTMTAGNLYEVKGSYTLSSADKAMLAAFTTVNSNDPENPKFEKVPIQKTQTVMVDKGQGHFTLLFYMWQNGNPHVSFYPAEGGGDIGGVYFGTGSSLWK
jgi:hypothetical protein